MVNMLIRDIPPEVHAQLVRRAKRRNQSLQQYISWELARLVEKQTLDELLEDIDRDPTERVGLSEALEAVEEARRA